MPSPAELNTLEQQRQKLLNRFDGLKAVVESPVASEAPWKLFATTAMREAALTELETESTAYVRYLIELVSTHKALAGHYFYFWGTAFTDKQNRAFDDYRYEVACVYYNLGALYANVARYVARPSVSPNTVELAAKESYGLLCKAAGFLHLAKQCMEHMSGTPTMTSKEEMIEDAKCSFLDVLINTVLGEAQEMGLLKALTGSSFGENWKKSPLPPKLAQRTFQLFDAAADQFQNKVAPGSYRDAQSRGSILAKELQLKKVAAQAQALLYQASCRFEEEPKEGLWFLGQHRAVAAQVLQLTAKTLSGPQFSDGRDWIAVLERTWRNDADRIEKLNSLVTRAKAGEGPYEMAPPQELARPRANVTLPLPLV